MSNKTNMQKGTVAFLAGAATGGLVALLLAPSSGRELRQKAAERADEVSSEIKRRATDARVKASEVREQSEAKLSELWEGGKNGAQARKEAVLAAYRQGLEAYEERLNGN